jgi:hypothetical protein
MSDAYERAKAASAASAKRIAFGHPAQWSLPIGEAAAGAFDRDLAAERDDLDDLDDADLERWLDDR